MPHIVTSLMPQWASDAVTAVRTGWQVFKANRKRRSDPRGGEAMMANIFGAAGAYAFPSGWAVEKQEQVRHNRAWNYIAIRAICEEIARHCPQAGYRRGPDDIGDRKKNKRLLSPYHRRKSLTSIQDHEEIEAVDSDHDLLQLMRNPNGPEVGYTFWYRLPLFMELTGENYWWKVRNRLGEVVELWNLFPQWVTPKPGRERLIDAYEVRPWAYGSNGVGMFTVPPEDIVAFRYPSALTMINGHSPIQSCSEWIDTAEAIDASRWYAFENGNHPGTLIELDEKVFGQKPVPKADLNRFYAEYAERMGGREKHRAPLVMNPGMTAKPWSNTPAEMDYTASSDQNRDWVMAIHRVGKSIAGIVEDVNYASSVTATANFLQRTVGPKLTHYGQVITEQLAAEFDPNLLVYWPDMTPDDPEQRNKDIDQDFRAGAITPNEIRRLRGREPYEHGGDDPMMPAALVPMPWVSGETDQPQEWGQGDEQPQMDAAGQDDAQDEFAKGFDPSQPRDADGKWTTVYHATARSNLPSMQEHGINDGMVTDDLNDAKEYAQMLRNRGEKDVAILRARAHSSHLESMGVVETASGKRIGERFNVKKPLRDFEEHKEPESKSLLHERNGHTLPAYMRPSRPPKLKFKRMPR